MISNGLPLRVKLEMNKAFTSQPLSSSSSEYTNDSESHSSMSDRSRSSLESSPAAADESTRGSSSDGRLSSIDLTKQTVMKEETDSLCVQDDLVNTSAGNAQRQKNFKICSVCGDRALGYNFNAISCESCKAFFRRNAFRTLWGRCDGTCDITVSSRAYCKKCRLKKCYSVGMKRDLILNERQKEERRHRINENRVRRTVTPAGEESCDTAAKLTNSLNPETLTAVTNLAPETVLSNSPVPEGMMPTSHKLAGDIPKQQYAGLEPHNEIILEEIINAFQNSFDCPIDRKVYSEPSNADFLNMADLSVRRLVKLSKRLTLFRDLSSNDQVSCLKGSVLEVLVLRSVKMFDGKGQTWTIPAGQNKVTITSKPMQAMNTKGADFMLTYQKFALGIVKAIRHDNILLMLIIVISIFAADRDNIEDSVKVSRYQEKIAEVMRDYITLKYPRDKVMFARVIQKLTDIRELHEIHNKMLQSSSLDNLEPLIVEIFDL